MSWCFGAGGFAPYILAKGASQPPSTPPRFVHKSQALRPLAPPGLRMKPLMVCRCPMAQFPSRSLYHLRQGRSGAGWQRASGKRSTPELPTIGHSLLSPGRDVVEPCCMAAPQLAAPFDSHRTDGLHWHLFCLLCIHIFILTANGAHAHAGMHAGAAGWRDFFF